MTPTYSAPSKNIVNVIRAVRLCRRGCAHPCRAHPWISPSSLNSSLTSANVAPARGKTSSDGPR